MRSPFAAAIALACASCASANVVYSDGTFSNADWGFELVSVNGSTGSANSSQSVAGGNPGSSRQTFVTQGTQVNGVTYAVNRFGTTQASRYVPSVSGAITSLNFSVDARFDSPPPSIFLAGVFAMVKQDNRVYVFNTGAIFSNTGWQTFSSTGLTANAFSQISGTSAPLDFSAAGAPLRFGYAIFVGDGVSVRTGEVFIDNFNLEVVAVPAPAAGALAMLGATTLLLRRRTYHRA